MVLIGKSPQHSSELTGKLAFFVWYYFFASLFCIIRNFVDKSVTYMNLHETP